MIYYYIFTRRWVAVYLCGGYCCRCFCCCCCCRRCYVYHIQSVCILYFYSVQDSRLMRGQFAITVEKLSFVVCVRFFQLLISLWSNEKIKKTNYTENRAINEFSAYNIVSDEISKVETNIFLKSSKTSPRVLASSRFVLFARVIIQSR